nr:MAG TPA: hypothetical protein [Caudoviricetes sp.]
MNISCQPKGEILTKFSDREEGHNLASNCQKISD